MKTKSLSVLLSATILLNSFPIALAEDANPAKVRELTRTIKNKYKIIGQNLVLLSYARLMGENLDFQQHEATRNGALSLTPSGDAIRGSIIEVQEEVFPLLFSDKAIAEKEDRFKNLFLDLEKSWITQMNATFEYHKVKDQILNEYEFGQTICTKKNFQESLKFLDSTSPELYKFTDLVMDQKFEVNVTYSEETGFGSNAAYDVDSEGETKAAVAVGLGAAAETMLASSAGGPAGLIAGAVIVIVLLAWNISDVREHNKVMKKLLKANNELFKNLNMAEQVEESYMASCKSVENAYTESKPHVQAILGQTASPQVKEHSLKSMEAELMRLEGLGPYEETAYMANLTEDSGKFSNFFKFHLYKKVLSLHSSMDGNEPLNELFLKKYLETKKMIYSSLEQMYLLEAPATHTSSEVSFAKYFEFVKSLELVRADFNNRILSLMRETSSSKKTVLLVQAENLVLAYENHATLHSRERDDFLKMAKSTLTRLKGL